MRISRLYLPRPLAAGAEVPLDRQASNYLLKVLRLRPGAVLRIFNGEGGEYDAQLLDGQPAALRLGDFHADERESNLDLQLVQGVSKGERMDITIQKAVELGVTRITPVFSERSVVQLKGERLEKRQQRWQAIIASACEQCGRNRLPHLETARLLPDWLRDYHPAEGEAALLLDPRNGRSLSQLPAPQRATLLIGPEGGLSDAETDAARDAGFQALQLGPRVLRTETAAIASLAILQALWGDLGA